MQSTPYPEVNVILDLIQGQLQEIFGARLVGLYLYGSLVWGDFDLGISDIDLLAVVATELQPLELDALQQMHAALATAHPQWDDHIEVAYVSRATLKTFRTEPSQFANISPGEPFHVVDVSRHWLLNWYVVQERGRVLYGLPAREVIDPISRAEYQQVVCDHLDGWGEWIYEARSCKAQAYAILTMCRAMVALETGEQLSKRQAGLWVEGQLPEWSEVICDALAWRAAPDETGAAAEAAFERTVRFVESIRAREQFRCREA